MENEKYLSRQQVADKLGISPFTWDDIVSQGVAPAHILVAQRPRLKRWKATEIDAWMVEYGQPVDNTKAPTVDPNQILMFPKEQGKEEDVEHGEDNPVID